MVRGVTAAVFFLLPQYNFSNRGSLTFEPLTLVPIQTKMIDVDSLTDKEVMGKSWWQGGKELPFYFRGIGHLSMAIRGLLRT